MSNGSEHIPERRQSDLGRVREQIVLPKVTRVEVIEARGRSFVAYGYFPAGATVSLQDDQRTVKLFVGARPDGGMVDDKPAADAEREELFRLWLRHGSSFESDHSEGYELADALLAAGWRKEGDRG